MGSSGCNGRVNDSSIGIFSKMPRFLKIFARRRRRHENGRCGSLLENRRFPRVSWFFMGLGSFEGCQSKKKLKPKDSTCKNRSRYSRKRATFCRNFADRPSSGGGGGGGGAPRVRV